MTVLKFFSMAISAIFSKLSKGTRVVYITGNHDDAFRKYSDLDWLKSGFHPGGFNHRVIRYADVLLMLAECEAEVGTPAQAASYINEVRARPSVNMPPVAPATKNDALKVVMHERAVELAGEEVASIDILRWRKKRIFPFYYD